MFKRFNIINSDRREFLQSAGAATLGISWEPRVIQAAESGPEATADSVILLWMGEAWRPLKRLIQAFCSLRKRMDPTPVLSTFPAIDTVCDHIKISEGLEKVASVMDRATLIRSYTAGDLGHILHSRHQYHWHTGYAPTNSGCPSYRLGHCKNSGT